LWKSKEKKKKERFLLCVLQTDWWYVFIGEVLSRKGSKPIAAIGSIKTVKNNFQNVREYLTKSIKYIYNFIIHYAPRHCTAPSTKPDQRMRMCSSQSRH